MARKSWWQDGEATGKHCICRQKGERNECWRSAGPLETSPQTQPAACILGHSESSHTDGEDSQGRIMDAYM